MVRITRCTPWAIEEQWVIGNGTESNRDNRAAQLIIEAGGSVSTPWDGHRILFWARVRLHRLQARVDRVTEGGLRVDTQ